MVRDEGKRFRFRFADRGPAYLELLYKLLFEGSSPLVPASFHLALSRSLVYLEQSAVPSREFHSSSTHARCDSPLAGSLVV